MSVALGDLPGYVAEAETDHVFEPGVGRPRSRRVSGGGRARVKWNRIATGSVVVRWFERRVIRTSTCGALTRYWDVSEQETASSLHPSMSSQF